MLQWLQAHWGDLVVLLVLGACVGGILRGMYRSRKKGGGCAGCSGCSGSSGCSLSGSCQSQKP